MAGLPNFNFMNIPSYEENNYSSGIPEMFRNLAETLKLIALSKQLNGSQRNEQTQYSWENYNPDRPYNPNYDPTSPTGKIGFKSGTLGDLMAVLRQRESGGNYGAQNTLGYSGAYQFGAPALETVGYLKPGTGNQGNQALNDPSNWTIPGGKEAFLKNKSLQDMAMKKLMESNRQKLQSMGIVNKQTPPHILNAMLAAAHLAGPGGVKALLGGRNRKDAYGTPASEYFNLGLRTI